MKIFKPPQKVYFEHQKSVFLAGSIDNGKSVDWQAEVTQKLGDLDVVVLNPRRDDWDASWTQSIANPQFREQVEWEMDGLELSDFILIHFASGSMAPISLLELGLHAKSAKMIVSCASDFWRRGNIEVVCFRYGIPLFSELKDAVAMLRNRLT